MIIFLKIPAPFLKAYLSYYLFLLAFSVNATLPNPLVLHVNTHSQDFPGGILDKNPSNNARDMDSNLSPGRLHMPRSN